MKLWEQTQQTQEIYTGRVIHVHNDTVLLENGKTAKREVVEHGGGVCAAVLTAQNEVLLVRQFRYPYKQVLWELPAGKLEKGEDPFVAVQREQLEETETTAKDGKYVYLGELYPSPGYCGEIIRIWACREGERALQQLDEDEFLEVERVPLEKAVQMILNGEIPDAKTQVGILKLQHLLSTGSLGL